MPMKKVITCPHCGSADMHYEAGLITGYKYHCNKCDYVGAFVIEKDIPVKKK
ncbi:MAG: TFIIB-type zinc ribbon-containing protein [Thermoplasmata archaeon]|nr:TFIIB-type zinc ribbon-containing protein [Thermoplasmata archaeon]